MKNNLQISSVFGLRTLAILIAYSLFLNTILLSDKQMAKAASKGEELYGLNCAACHKGGHNIVNAKKPVIGSTTLASKQTFKGYLLKPTGTMPPYPAIANNDADLTALYNYCKSLR
jgi:mono/diheme cytochrome c family protein